MTPGAYYAEHLMPVLSPGKRPDPRDIVRDIGILKSRLAREPLEDTLMVCKEVRRQANFGQLKGWIEPGEAFTLRALLAVTAGVNTYERFKHEALKKSAAKKAPVGQSVADIFATIAARGRVV